MDNKRPYFLWDYNLSEDKVKQVLRGKNEYDKEWLISRILESAKFKDVWKYVTLGQVKKIFPKLKLKRPIWRAWDLALRVWQ